MAQTNEIPASLPDSLPPDELLYDLADLFRVFGDSTRVRILFLLLERDMRVSGIAGALHMTQSAISHQLRVLKNANLVRSRRDGRTSVYYLTDDHVRTILSCGMEHVTE